MSRKSHAEKIKLRVLQGGDRMAGKVAVEKNGDAYIRLAVIEEKLEMILTELAAIRSYIPGKIIEHSEKLAVLERSVRTILWLGGVIAAALIGAFIAHVLRG